MKLTLLSITDGCRNESDAYLLLEELRWHGTPICAHCGHDKVYFLQPKNGVTRSTRTGSESPRRVYKCAKCRRQFSVLTNTIFHGTKIPLRTWLLVLAQVSSAKNGISAREVARMHEITPETAWHMMHRIREAMKLDPFAGMLAGTIMADETFFGGSEKNKHQKDRTPGRGAHNKTPIVSLVNKETGEVRSQVVQFIAGPDLRKAIEQHVDIASSVLHTDKWGGYVSVGREFQEHESVDHAQGEYVRGDVTTNHVEGFFSQLKRSIDGTHHQVSTEHLHRYVTHADFNYTTRKLDDSARMARLVGQVTGRRLPYRPLTVA